VKEDNQKNLVSFLVIEQQKGIYSSSSTIKVAGCVQLVTQKTNNLRVFNGCIILEIQRNNK
jgi:hypothetical protein